MLFHKKRRHTGWLSLLWVALLLCKIAVFMEACAVVPEQMQVDTGLNPKYQDDDVRFRTTYYFRVFDYCADPDKPGIKTPFAIDSLYRFTMTGKANSLTTTVNFESGTLTAGQIDPFGATVAFDKENRQFFFKTQEQVQQEAARARQFNELERLVHKYQELRKMLREKTGEPVSPDNPQILEKFIDILEKMVALKKEAPDDPARAKKLDQLQKEIDALKPKLFAKSDTPLSAEDQQLLALFRSLIANQISLIKGIPGSLPQNAEIDQLLSTLENLRQAIDSKTPKSDEDNKHLARVESLMSDVMALQINRLQQQTTNVSQTQSIDDYCQNLRRGFQILGPEGWRTFNQDERLIMAMNATGEPLIATMQELAGRVLDNQPIEAEMLLPLIEEDLRITRTERVLDKFSLDEPEKVPELLEKAFNAFKE